MKIIEQSEDRLEVILVPWLEMIMCLLFGPGMIAGAIDSDGDALWVRIAMIVGGAAITAYLIWTGGWMKYTFDRTSGKLTWTYKRLFKPRRAELSLKGITGVTVDNSKLDYWGFYQVVFLSDGGQLAFPPGIKLGRDSKFIKTAHAWLNSPEATN